MAEDACAWFVTRLGDYLEGVLPREDRVAMDEHRLACRQCGALLRDYARIPALIRRATDRVMPPGAQARLRRKLSRLWRSRS